ncbi:RHS repeat-associated core domain-containing protein [Paraburkholderia humisilvae]|uniref:RHS repeat-associated core domain-containing protein n=1 Tax=Paraburkholderia humisilvae TaxID=627669 RepID=UPI0031B60E91
MVAVANSTGATTSGQGYGPFGETDGTLPTRFGYTGPQYLAPLGLYYYKARFYWPALGRFLQTDPVGYTDDVNWYAYVGRATYKACLTYTIMRLFITEAALASKQAPVRNDHQRAHTACYGIHGRHVTLHCETRPQ